MLQVVIPKEVSVVVYLPLEHQVRVKRHKEQLK